MRMLVCLFFSLPGISQVEVLIAISSVTSPLLFSASGFLSSSVISFIEIFLHDVPTSKVSSMKRKCAGFIESIISTALTWAPFKIQERTLQKLWNGLTEKSHLESPKLVFVCVCVVQQSYDILLLILMVLLLVQAILTSATVVHCASYKSQLRMGAPECDDSVHAPKQYCEVRQIKARLIDANEQICLSFSLLVHLSTSSKTH